MLDNRCIAKLLPNGFHIEKELCAGIDGREVPCAYNIYLELSTRKAYVLFTSLSNLNSPNDDVEGLDDVSLLISHRLPDRLARFFGSEVSMGSTGQNYFGHYKSFLVGKDGERVLSSVIRTRSISGSLSGISYVRRGSIVDQMSVNT